MDKQQVNKQLKNSPLLSGRTTIKPGKVQTTYQENLQGISDAIHPFSRSDISPDDAEKVEGVLETRAKAIERLAIYLTTIN